MGYLSYGWDVHKLYHYTNLCGSLLLGNMAWKCASHPSIVNRNRSVLAVLTIDTGIWCRDTVEVWPYEVGASTKGGGFGKNGHGKGVKKCLNFVDAFYGLSPNTSLIYRRASKTENWCSACWCVDWRSESAGTDGSRREVQNSWRIQCHRQPVNYRLKPNTRRVRRGGTI